MALRTRSLSLGSSVGRSWYQLNAGTSARMAWVGTSVCFIANAAAGSNDLVCGLSALGGNGGCVELLSGLSALSRCGDLCNGLSGPGGSGGCKVGFCGLPDPGGSGGCDHTLLEFSLYPGGSGGASRLELLVVLPIEPRRDKDGACVELPFNPFKLLKSKPLKPGGPGGKGGA